MLEVLRHAWDALWAVPHIRLYLTIGWIAYLVGLGVYIVLQKREPAATISWLVSLAALPYLGFIVYQVLGPQRINRQTLRRERHRLALPQAGRDDLGHEAIELGNVAQATCSAPPSSAHAVRVLVDGAATYDALLEAIAGARDHVHLEYYIFSADRSGALVRDALVERARAGVKVRLLLDALGSAKTPRRFFDALLDAGGELAWFHPSRFGRVWTRTWINLRSHRKIVVVDGRVGFIGGINVTDDENERVNPDAYRDLHLRVDGDIVHSLQALFVDDWAYATGTRDFIGEVVRAMPAPSPGPVHAQVLASGPDTRWETIHRLHVGAIHAARRRVWMATPYFVPGEAAMMALTSAAHGGLDVRLMVPRNSDSRLVTYAARSYFDELLAAGVKVYEYGPRMLHSKALLVDDATVIIGSANFDHRSFRLNFEASLLIVDVGVGTALEQVFAGDFAHAPRVRDDRDRSLLRARLPEAFARLLSPLL